MSDYNEKWKDELDKLKSIIKKTGLKETIKWGAEVYTYKGKNLVSFGGFRNFFALWFYNGVFLKDHHKVLVSAQEGKTKALRQWRFASGKEIDEKLITEYILEAIRNEEEGKFWKPQKSGMTEIPQLLENEFNINNDLKKAFNKITPYKQKEYMEYINSAKMEETKLKRINKIAPMIFKGIGLNDKYKPS